MKSAFCRISNMPGAVRTIDASSVSRAEEVTIRHGAITLSCPNCLERVFFSKETPDKKPGQKGYRPAHFKHQHKKACAIEDCDLRVDVGYEHNKPLSQRLRVPLFLRPGAGGHFVLSIGFSTANKTALKNLQTRRFNKLLVQKGGEAFTAKMEDLVNEQGSELFFLDLPTIIAKKNNVKAAVVSDDGEQTLSLNDANAEWSDVIDWFSDHHGAVFQYSAGNAGEKVPSGNRILAGRPYLVVEKDTSSQSAWNIKSFLVKMAERYAPDFVYEYKGSLLLKGGASSYIVHKVIFPSSEKMSAKDYGELTDWVRDHLAVMLCDDVPETRPLWPPASRKGDAYAVAAESNTTMYVTVSGAGTGTKLFQHKDSATAEEVVVDIYNGIAVGSVPILSRRTPLSFDEILMGAVSSYRAEAPHKAAPHGIVVNDDEIVLDEANCYEAEITDNGNLVLSSSCPFTIYRVGQVPEDVAAGTQHVVKAARNEPLFIRTNAGTLYVLRARGVDTCETAHRNRYANRYHRSNRYENRYIK